MNRTENFRFANSCFLSVTCSIFFAAAALLIYFLLPSKAVNVNDSDTNGTVAQTDFQVIYDDDDISEDFQTYLTEASYELLNSSTDGGLTLYRQSMSRSAVEWFYTHITGNRDVALAILAEADNNDIPLSLAFALAYTESRYNTKATNKNSNETVDRGLFQLNSNSFPALTEADFYDPYISSKYGMSHLKFCLSSAGNEVSALAMYNAGTNRVRSNKTPQVTLNYVGKIVSYQKMLESLFYQEVVSYYETQFVPGITVAYTGSSKLN